MNLQDFATLAEAQAHEVTTSRLIHRDTFNGILSLAGVYSAMKKIASTEGHPAQNQMDAFMDSVEFNFMDGESNSTGEIQKAALDSLIAANISIDMAGTPVAVSAILGAVKPVILARANPVSKPFATATKQAFDIAKGTIVREPVRHVNGFCTVTTNADTEAHNPQIYKRIEVTTGDYEFIRVAGFGAVTTAGQYRVQCPSFANMFIDNAYGVVEPLPVPIEYQTDIDGNLILDADGFHIPVVV